MPRSGLVIGTFEPLGPAWWESRDADTPAMLDRDPAPHALRATLDAAKAQFDLNIIDTPPAAPEMIRLPIASSDRANHTAELPPP